MLWYKRFYNRHEFELDLELDPDYDYDSEQGHYLLALGLSFFFYAILLAFVFLEIPHQLQKNNTGAIPLGNDLINHLPRRANPARVVSMPAPRKSQAPTPLAVPINIPEPEPIKPVLAPEPIKPAPEPVAQPQFTPPVPVNSARNGETQITPPEKPGPDVAPAPKLPTRQGRGSWFKKSSTPETRPEQPGPVSYNRGPNTAFSQLETISTQQVSRLPVNSDGGDGDPTYGSPFGSGKTMSPEAVARNMEFELFATRLIHTICDASRQQPLYTTHNPITPHTTTLTITVGRDRKIRSVKFIHASPHRALNDYIERVIYSVLAPQLPASLQKDQIVMPLSIDMRSSPGAGEIYFVPGSRG